MRGKGRQSIPQPFGIGRVVSGNDGGSPSCGEAACGDSGCRAKIGEHENGEEDGLEERGGKHDFEEVDPADVNEWRFQDVRLTRNAQAR